MTDRFSTSYFPRDQQRPMVDFVDRDQRRQLFLARQGLAQEEIIPLRSDASFRRYFYLPQKNALVMDSPPHLYPTQIFHDRAALLARLGTIAVPTIHAADHDDGFLQLEYLGDQSLTALLNRQNQPQKSDDGKTAEELYRLVLNGLWRTQAAFMTTHDHHHHLPDYDGTVLLREAALLPDWYVGHHTNSDAPIAEEQRQLFLARLMAIYQQLLAAHAPPRPVFVHRDFHVDNLLYHRGDIAWLDFQDALLGHPVYDVMSLLEDARRDLPPLLQKTLWQEFIAAWQNHCPQQQDIEKNFTLWFHFLGLTRHAKVLGIFVRLNKRDGKTGYDQHLPRVLRLFRRSFHNLKQTAPADQPWQNNIEQLEALLSRWRLL